MAEFKIDAGVISKSREKLRRADVLVLFEIAGKNPGADVGKNALEPLSAFVFDATACPSVSLSTNPRFRAVITVLGLNPLRTLSAEERLGGIESLNPPTVYAKGPAALIKLAVRAVLASVEATGTEVTPAMLAVVSYSVAHSVRGALLSAGIDA